VSDKPDDERGFKLWDAMRAQAAGSWAESRRLAAAMRMVIERLIKIDAPEDELRRAAEGLERYAGRLETHPQRMRPAGFAEAANAGDIGAFFDYSPLIGLSNPLAPPISLWADGDRVYGTVTFGSAYEGPPGCLHGGFVAASFDEVLGFVQSLTGRPGMTAKLVTRYRQPTPLHTELRFEARVTRSDGRKNFAEGRLYAGETLCAEAEAIFIAIDREKVMELDEAQARLRREPS
jgi:acyl-coenzyme A thioesterase PaaI-like protein